MWLVNLLWPGPLRETGPSPVIGLIRRGPLSRRQNVKLCQDKHISQFKVNRDSYRDYPVSDTELLSAAIVIFNNF